MFLQIFSLLGAIGLFLYGLNMLSNGLLKLSGDRLQKFLPWMKKNPVNSILSGFCITTIAESSSAATVMVVSFVNAGVLALSQAILVIMGANIGASFTTWIIALLGFLIDIKYVTYPLIAVGFILTMMKGQKRKVFGDVLLGFGLLFLGVSFIMSTFPSTGQLHGLAYRISELQTNNFLGVPMFMAIGCILAFGMQSTGAVTLTMVMLSCGWINFDLAAAMVLGENIGTTISANMAATDANIQAKRAALVHTFFNVFGAVLALIAFKPLIGLVGCITTALGIAPGIWAGVFGIALFHTLFNLFDTCILAWFTKFIEKLVTKCVQESDSETNEYSNLIYITSRNFGTPAIAISQAFKEVVHFAEILRNGFDNVKKAVMEKDPDKFEEYRVKLVHLEELSDKLEYEIAGFLSNVSTGNLTEEEAEQVKVLYRVIGELESLGDSGENISRILERERVHNRKFDDDSISKILTLSSKVEKGYDVMVENLKNATTLEGVKDISNAYASEDDINETRNKLREEGILQIEHHTGNYQSLNYFLDMIAELEAMGDFMINVSQAIVRNDN
jgi:phosphate:Na+ symporter